MRARRPDVLVTIDSPGFTLRLLRRLSGSGIARVHYVAPQVWAWREQRVREFPGLWERLLCLLPFEPAFFARHGLPATFVGHPVLQSGADRGDAARFRAAHGLAADAKVLVLMPGSRRNEVPRLLPVFGATLSLLAGRIPGLVPVVPVASAVAETVRRAAEAWPVRPVIVTELADKHDAYAAAAGALTKSGTSTLELALAGVPMAVTYRVNPISAAIARRLIRVTMWPWSTCWPGTARCPNCCSATAGRRSWPKRWSACSAIPPRRRSSGPPSGRWPGGCARPPARRPRRRRGRYWRCWTRVARRRRRTSSAVSGDRRGDGGTGPGQIVRHHYRVKFHARIERQEPRLGDRRDLRGVLHVEYRQIPSADHCRR